MNPQMNDQVPAEFICPIGQIIMEDPVQTQDGFTFDRHNITAWLARKNTNPMTGLPLKTKNLIPNRVVKQMIDDYLEKQPERKKEREEKVNQKAIIEMLQNMWNNEVKEKKENMVDDSFSEDSFQMGPHKETPYHGPVMKKQPIQMLSKTWERNLEKFKNEFAKWKQDFKYKKPNLSEVINYNSREERGEYIQHGRLNGKVMVRWKAGDYLQCQYIGGRPEGKGVMNFKNGNIYEGQYKNGVPHGLGIEYHHSGDIFEGEYRNGRKQGLGRYLFKDGGRYEGQFRKGERQGKGVYFKMNGSRFEGNFLKGKPENGMKFYQDGTIKVIEKD